MSNTLTDVADQIGFNPDDKISRPRVVRRLADLADDLIAKGVSVATNPFVELEKWIGDNLASDRHLLAECQREAAAWAAANP